MVPEYFTPKPQKIRAFGDHVVGSLTIVIVTDITHGIKGLVFDAIDQELVPI